MDLIIKGEDGTRPKTIHNLDDPRTPGTGTSFGVTDLLLRMSVIHGVIKSFQFFHFHYRNPG